MNEEATGLLSIGEFARLSKLSISALRFYGDCGVLTPKQIDGATGYRFYAPDQLPVAELIRELRALEMPIVDIQSFLTATPTSARAILDMHWTRLQRRVERNREALAAVRLLLCSKETSMSASTNVEGGRLAVAIRQVLPAAGELPRNQGPAAVLVELREDCVRLVATDGHRLAVRDLPLTTTGKGRVVVGEANAARIASIVETARQVTLKADEALSVDVDGESTLFEAASAGYPDYEAVLARAGDATLLVKSKELADQLAQANDMVVLSLSEKECAANGASLAGRYTGDDLRVAFNPTYLGEALSSGIGPDVIVQLSGPEDPALIRSADDGSFSWLVMPIRMKAAS